MSGMSLISVLTMVLVFAAYAGFNLGHSKAAVQ